MEQRQFAQIEEELFLREAWLCPRCSKTVMNAERHCVSCGLPTKKKCEGCGGFNRPQNSHCQSCGERFPSQKTELSVVKDEELSTLLTLQGRLGPFLKKFRSELKNPRNFKFEPTMFAFIKKRFPNYFQSQDSETYED